MSHSDAAAPPASEVLARVVEEIKAGTWKISWPDAQLLAAQVERDQARIAELEGMAAATPAGHGETCVYCSETCNALAGNPSKWPMFLRPGEIGCRGCVLRRLAAPAPQQAPSPGAMEIAACPGCGTETQWPYCEKCGWGMLDRVVEEPDHSAERLVGELITEISELPDRTSPDDQPDMLMLTWQELQAVALPLVAGALEAAKREGAKEAINKTTPGFREVASALRMIRDAVDELAPVGGAPSRDVGPPNYMQDADDIITGILAIVQAAKLDGAAEERNKIHSMMAEESIARGRREGIEEVAARLGALRIDDAAVLAHFARSLIATPSSQSNPQPDRPGLSRWRGAFAPAAPEDDRGWGDQTNPEDDRRE